ncbi:MAG: hypothetical protein V6Z86_05920 [Hyphomicrobiales bacterium]
MPTPLEFDARHLWHPYSNIAAPGPAHPLAQVQGVWLIGPNGERMIDAMSSWWCAIHGYPYPHIV